MRADRLRTGVLPFTGRYKYVKGVTCLEKLTEDELHIPGPLTGFLFKFDATVEIAGARAILRLSNVDSRMTRVPRLSSR